MDQSSRSFRELLEKRPLNVQAVFGGEPVALVSGRDIAAAARRGPSSSQRATLDDKGRPYGGLDLNAVAGTAAGKHIPRLHLRERAPTGSPVPSEPGGVPFGLT